MNDPDPNEDPLMAAERIFNECGQADNQGRALVVAVEAMCLGTRDGLLKSLSFEDATQAERQYRFGRRLLQLVMGDTELDDPKPFQP